MIYSFNTLGWYKTKANRQYDNTGNERILHHFETNKIPSFQLIIDATITTASYELFDSEDTLISNGSVTVENDTNNAGVAYSRLIFLGTTLTSKDDGFYYIKITYDTSNYIFSDVFCWLTDVSEYLKIEAVSSNFSIGGFTVNTTGFTYLVYLQANDSILEYEIDEEGIEKTFGDIPLYNTRRKMNQFEITGYRVTLDFLSGLRVLWANGTVTLTFKGDEFEIYDMENPESGENYSYSDIIVMTLKFKRKDFIQTINTV